jgi:hypothetical protein
VARTACYVEGQLHWHRISWYINQLIMLLCHYLNGTSGSLMACLLATVITNKCELCCEQAYHRLKTSNINSIHIHDDDL